MTFFLYLPGWEIRILCSHCPYYAEKGFILHCPINYGSLNCGDIIQNQLVDPEGFQLIIGFIILFGYPFPFLIINGQYILVFLIVSIPIIMFWVLLKYSCLRCINFSCPSNRASREIINEFLKRNPVLRKAWEEKSWKIT